jgi:autotransporter-associated beta strand protein
MFPGTQRVIVGVGRSRIGRPSPIVACRWAYLVPLAALWGAALSPAPANGAMSFALHYIATAANTTWAYGGVMNTTLSDINGDGKLDWTVGNCEYNLQSYWYEYQNADTWVKHTIYGSSPGAPCAAAVSTDVTGDGRPDFISGRYLFINVNNGASWTKYNIATSTSANVVHDHYATDINGDGRTDLVSTNWYSGGVNAGIVWYEQPLNPTTAWTQHFISNGVPAGYQGICASSDPQPMGDLNGDGLVDIVATAGWIQKNNAAGTSWTEHWNTDVFLGDKNGTYQTGVKNQVIDLNGDGFLDIVQSEMDTSHPVKIAWLKNDGLGNFTRNIIRQGYTEDYHSLSVADFDKDGDLDILTGAGPIAKTTVPGSIDHGVFMFENTAGAGHDPVYAFHNLSEFLSSSDATELATAFASDREHDSRFGDVDGDGDMDLILKGYGNAGNGSVTPAPFLYLENKAPVNTAWTGGTSTIWSTATGLGNWKWTSNNADCDYVNDAAVIFDDAATGSLTASINAADVSPTSVVFNNSTNAYVVSGTKGITGSATVLKQGTAKVTISSVNSYSGITTLEGGTLQFNKAAAWNPVVNLGGANIKAGTMVFDYAGEGTPAAAIGALLTASYHSGSATHFDTGKFQSSSADANHGLGWIETMSQQVLVAYTLYGDATVDGAVDISDLSALGQNWNGNGKNWSQGDFNYDGKVDISDLSALGQHWNQSVPGFIGGGMGSDSGAAVPEPGTLVLLGMGGLGLLAYAWRRR